MNNKRRLSTILALISSVFSSISIVTGPNVGMLSVGGVLLGTAAVLFFLSLRENEYGSVSREDKT